MRTLDFRVVLDALVRARGTLELEPFIEHLFNEVQPFSADELGDVLTSLEIKRFVTWDARGVTLLPGFGVR